MTTLTRAIKGSFLLLPMLWLGGCSGMLTQSGGSVPVEEGTGGQQPLQNIPVVSGTTSPQGTAPGPIPAPPVQAAMEDRTITPSPAIAALLNQADKERQAGRYEYAAASIERALSLEPQNALLWSRLAAIRLDQRNLQQAIVLAGRSNSLSRNNRTQQLQNWRIIAQAKARLGDSTGAAAARQMILRLGGND